MDYKRVLILRFTNGMSSREIAEATGDGKTTINEFLKRFRECGVLSYPLSEDITNEFIGELLYRKTGNIPSTELYRDIDPESIHRAMTKKGETLKHLWKKYNAAGTVDGKKPLSYRQFCRRYTSWLDSSKVTFHIQRFPGVNLELDYAGKILRIQNRYNPSQSTLVTIFVAALSYSDYFYIEGMTRCDISNWIRVNNNAIAYFGGITQTVTPDNCKVAVTENKDWINPSLNKDFQAWAEHNGTVIMPAKVRKPRWKPNVEGHVKIMTMHILVDMDEMTFYSLEELNAVLWEKMEQENRVNFQGLTYSRKELFEREEKESLLPLPEAPYEYLERKMVKVSQDFSFTYDKVHYSMPRKYLKRTLEIRAGANKIYVYNENGDLIRTHDRSYTPKSWVVIPSDMPKEYSDYGYWNKPYFLAKAEQVGPDTKILIERVMEKFPHPVQSFRSCYGILNFAEKYGKAALEACCHDAILHGKCNYTYIANTISMYAKPIDRVASSLKPMNKETSVNGVYKDDDDKYSLKNLLKRQEAAGFPYTKTMEEFDCSQLNEAVSPLFLQELASCQFIQNRQNVIMIGNPGRGKTHLAIALRLKACTQGYNVLFKNAATLSTELCEAKDNYHLGKLERTLAKADLLILDELSYLSFNRHQSELLFKVISGRSEKSSTIVTTNLPFSKWTELFENTTMVAALIDRLTFRSHVLDMNGDSVSAKSNGGLSKKK